jgi:hypothetical protein
MKYFSRKAWIFECIRQFLRDWANLCVEMARYHLNIYFKTVVFKYLFLAHSFLNYIKLYSLMCFLSPFVTMTPTPLLPSSSQLKQNGAIYLKKCVCRYMFGGTFAFYSQYGELSRCINENIYSFISQPKRIALQLSVNKTHIKCVPDKL